MTSLIPSFSTRAAGWRARLGAAYRRLELPRLAKALLLSFVLGGSALLAAVAVTIAPTTVTLAAGATQQFTATVTGSPNTAVFWTKTGGGSLTSTGLYTAPTTPGTYMVRATSQADFTKYASATVTVTAGVTVSISPATATVLMGGTQPFTATVSGNANTAVTWSVTEAGGGTVGASGLYTAPGTPGTYHVVATSQADPTRSATATVTVPAIAVSVAPATASLLTGGTQPFTATVTGTANQAVTWSVTEAGGGTVSPAGLYTAPGTAGSYHVVATSQADPTKSAQATVTVSLPPVSVAVSPSSATVLAGQTLAFTATVSNTPNTAVWWTVQEAGGGSVDSAGVYTPPLAGGTYHVVATSQADISKSATATVTVPGVAVAINPGQTIVATTGTQWFTARVTGAANPAVTWSVVEADGGSIRANGQYTPPATPRGAVHVTATSVADPSKSATATISLSATANAISPEGGWVKASGTQALAWLPDDPFAPSPAWTATGGSLSAGTGPSTTWTAPATPGLYGITGSAGVATVGASFVVGPAWIHLSPALQALSPGQVQTFSAQVMGSGNGAVSWRVVEAAGGSVTQGGVYTAPTLPGVYHLTATSQADPTLIAMATVTVAASNVGLAVTPFRSWALPTAQVTLASAVTGTPTTGVSWTASGGTLSTGGAGSGGSSSQRLWTAPANPGTYTLRATSQADPSQTTAVLLTVANAWVAVAPETVSLALGGTQPFTATVAGLTPNTVTWAVLEPSGGSVSPSGLYTAPNTPGTYHVSATSTADSTIRATATVIVLSAPAPTLTGFSPTSGPVGAGVTITGTNFTGVTGVAFNGTAATTFAMNSPTEIIASVPSGATTGPISVTTPGGTVNSATFFTVTVPPPTITGFSPTSGPVGAGVTITGTNFTGVTGVAFNGTAATTFAVNPPTEIIASVPSGATTGPITVTTPGGAVNSATPFTVEQPAQPPNISYNPPSQVYTVGTPITPWSPSNTGGTATSWSIDQPLPAGLGISSTTGVISGTPTATSPNTSYTVTATNAAGSASTTITLTVTTGSVSVTLNAGELSMDVGAAFSFVASVAGNPNTSVTWTASGGILGTPSGNSVSWTAPLMVGTCTVTATSQADPSKSATATIRVNPLVCTPVN
ncbi:MAG: IPT/TIG domain-containing protein [Acidobacteria bacterium]|nr:IPT/TIG domain-containing protein [Acidobacteriota bacterium]